MTFSIWKWFKRSITIVWARLMVLAAVLLELVAQVGDIPEVAALTNVFAEPRNAAIALAVIGIVTELVRRRTASRG